MTGGVLSFTFSPENISRGRTTYVNIDPPKDIQWEPTLPENQKKRNVMFNQKTKKYYFLFHGERNFENSASNQLFQVKCNLVNTESRILRSLVPKTSKVYEVHDLYRTEYHDIQPATKVIREITVEIMNRDGQPIQFQSGKVIMVLNLRPKEA